jgi:hypothetical protein
MPKSSWATHRFEKRDGMRHCTEPGCGASFQLNTSTDGLKKHFKNRHKAEAIALGFLDAPVLVAGAAVAADGPHSSQDSVVDMQLDDGASAAAASRPAPYAPSSGSKRSRSECASVSSPAAASAKRQQTLKSAFVGVNNAALCPAVALCFASNHIAYNVADSSSFAAMCHALRNSSCAIPKRTAVKAGISQLAVQLREEVLLRLSSKGSAAAASAAAAPPVRSQSVLEAAMRCLLESYIAQHGITLAVFDRGSRYWNNDRRNALQSALPPGGYMLDDAITSIRDMLEEQNE